VKYMEERRKLLQMASDLWERRLTNAAGGNLAMRVDDNRILVSPSMMSEHEHCRLAIEEPLLIDYDCNILEGTGAFSREGRMHALIMKNIPEIGGVIHAHPFYTMVFVAACKPVPQVTEATLKMAIQTGIPKPDIAAGLTYSICMNYMNRVKGNRSVGQKVYMQGGVCYNRAVPVAMAALIGKDIIVPPEPGLMGAYGVALETMSLLELESSAPQSFTLTELAQRDVLYERPFVCSGGREKCDRKCIINRIRVAGRLYPFGGACNKYYNIFSPVPEYDTKAIDLSLLRERLLMEACLESQRYEAKGILRKLGINRSLMTHTLFPLYYSFFKSLGYDVVMPEKPDADGCVRKGAAFCWPVEQAHGMLKALLDLKPDILFLPHIKAVPVPGGEDVCVTCPFVQAEPYMLKAAFPELLEMTVLSPVLDMTHGYEKARAVFSDIALNLGHNKEIAQTAFQNAVSVQNTFHSACREAGKRMLEELENNPDEIGIVLFGRPYNAFTALGNMGIPRKFASRGYKVIPLDFLPVTCEDSLDNMYWATGQWILKAARFVARHPQLFGVYITNFSCGPDSFVIGYFRDIMGRKPSLTLELDSHTADAGLDTRIEAYLDVIKRCRMPAKQHMTQVTESFITAEIENRNGSTLVIASDGTRYPLTHPRIKVLIPSMGDIASRMLAATLRYVGVNAVALPPPGKRELDLGRGLASCKECLPLLLTVGSLMRYVEEQWNREDILVNFMPETSGPCRFGQYNIMMRELVRKLQLPDITLLSLTAENAYAGFGIKFAMRAWQTIVLSDVLDDIYSAILALTENPEEAVVIFNTLSDSLCESIAQDSWPELKKNIAEAARALSKIKRKGNLGDLPSIALIGEIYVRRDGFSRQQLVERLSKQGILVRTAPISEWIHYCDYIVQNKLVAKSRWFDRVRNILTCYVKTPYEDNIRSLFAKSGFYSVTDNNVEHLIESAKHLVSPRLTGETILTVGAALAEAVESVDGVLALGPFGCMPARISESIVTQSLNTHKKKIEHEVEWVAKVLEAHPSLPFLSIETDGNAFPQLIESRLEAFLLQVRRIHKTIHNIVNHID